MEDATRELIRALVQLDHKVLVDGADTTADYLAAKLVANLNATLTIDKSWS